VLYERGLAPANWDVAARNSVTSLKTPREVAIYTWLEEEGKAQGSAANWNDCCGSHAPAPAPPPKPRKPRKETQKYKDAMADWVQACESVPADKVIWDTSTFVKGCGGEIIEGDAELGILIMCTFCYNSYHPKCANMKRTLKRLKHEWACPECVYVAEEDLRLEPLHIGRSDRDDIAEYTIEPASEVIPQIEDDDPNKEPDNKYSTQWLQWKIGNEPDFCNEENMLMRLIKRRGHLPLFLPKFHPELNWAELYWNVSKNDVRLEIDGTWASMTRAIWKSFGDENMPNELRQRFHRKCRELIDIYRGGLTGPFAIWCQKQFNHHREAFWDGEALKPWTIGSLGKCAPRPGLSRKMNCEVTQVVGEGHTATFSIKFPGGGTRHAVPLEALHRRRK
jgi:hypothetical protein